MKAAIFAEGKIETVSILPPATVYKIAAKNAPPEIVSYVLDRAAGGEIVPEREIREKFGEARHQKREAQREREKAERRRRMPRKKREEEDADKQRLLDHAKKWTEELEETVSTLIDKFGEADARFIAETLGRSNDVWSFIERLHNRLGIVWEVAD